MYVKDNSDMLWYRHSQGQASAYGTVNNTSLPDAYGRRTFIQQKFKATAIPCGRQNKLYVLPLYASGYFYAEA